MSYLNNQKSHSRQLLGLAVATASPDTINGELGLASSKAPMVAEEVSTPRGCAGQRPSDNCVSLQIKF